jgi:hypothetical protein
MAAKKAARIDDCQRTLALQSASTSVGAMTIHVPDMLMRANRRQYTQCRAYDVQLEFGATGGTAAREYHIYTLSNAWWVKRAIEMAKGVYMDATKSERAILDQTGRSAKWGDFIIHATTGAAGNFSNLIQYAPAGTGDDITGTEVASDESIFETSLTSQLKDDDGDEMGFSVLAEDVSGDGHFNIFDQYLLSRQHVNPQDTRASPYQELDVYDEDALVDLKQDGDQAPWDLDAFPSPFVLADIVTVDAEGSGDNLGSRMLTAPLGIVIVKKFGNDGSSEVSFVASETVLLRVRKGTYKGVHAPAYKAMNGVLGN